MRSISRLHLAALLRHIYTTFVTRLPFGQCRSTIRECVQWSRIPVAHRPFQAGRPAPCFGLMPADDLRSSPMMAYLMGALDEGKDIGHYGRLVFAIVARYFLPRDEVMRYLMKNSDFSEDEAASLIHQVSTHDYSTRSRILE